MSEKAYVTELGKFYILENDQWIGRVIKEGAAWDSDKIKKLLKYIDPEKNVIDVGANIGTYAIPFAKHINAEKCKVYCFEPQTVIFNLLDKNVLLNDITNIKTYHEAVGHLDDYTVTISNSVSDGISKGKKLKYNTNNIINYGGIELGLGGEKIQMNTLDSYNFENIGFIKIDVEGCEKLVLYGGLELIKREKPVILFENKKQISNEMRKLFPIDKKIEKFDILNYCKNTLKYKKILYFNKDILIIP
jgi:FkbM family methyltransferase